MKKKKYLIAGQFVEIYGVEKHALFHYDEVGLFRPVMINGNGHRYYSYHQYDTFPVIIRLKKVGTLLKDTKVLLEQRSSAAFLQLLEDKFGEVDREIEKLLALERMMVYMKESVLSAITHEDEDITTRQYPGETLLCSDDLENASSRSLASLVEEYISFCKEHNMLAQESVGCMIKTDSIRNRDYPSFSYLLTKIEKDICRNTYTRKEGSYLYVWHKGSYDTIQSTYERMFAYAERCNLITGPYAYEECLIADITQKDHTRYATYIRMDLVDQKQRELFEHYFALYPYLHNYALIPGIYQTSYGLRYNPANQPPGLLIRTGVFMHVILFYVVGTSPGKWLMCFSTPFPCPYRPSVQPFNATE